MEAREWPSGDCGRAKRDIRRRTLPRGEPRYVPPVSRTVYYAATTLDGFIAEPEEKLEWLTGFEGSGYAGDGGDDFASSYPEFVKTIGALVMGSRTYDFIAGQGEWPYGEMPAWVFTHRDLEPVEGAGGLRFMAGDVADHHEEIVAAAAGRDVWMLGGGDLASQYVRAGLLDLVSITVVPIILSAGLPLFAEPLPKPLRLLGSEPWENGMNHVRYEVPR